MFVKTLNIPGGKSVVQVYLIIVPMTSKALLSKETELSLNVFFFFQMISQNNTEKYVSAILKEWAASKARDF